MLENPMYLADPPEPEHCNDSVYVVIRYHFPDTSDWDIVAVLTSREEADKYISKMNPKSRPDGSWTYDYRYDWKEFELDKID